MTDRYCPLPWISVHSWCGDVTPCCQWEDKGVIAENTEAAIHSDLFKDIRKSMLENKELKGCTQCYQEEAAGKQSRRTEALKQYGRPTTVQLKLMDIGFDNVCNLKCRGCQGAASHLWYDDEIKMYGESLHPTKYWSYLADADFNNLEYIHIAGGEPLLSKNFEEFSKKLLKSDNLNSITLSCVTNGTVLPKKSILELFQKVGTLKIDISIDALGKLNNYFRSGSNFTSLLKNLNYYKEFRSRQNLELSIHMTVSVYNVNKIPETYEYFNLYYPEFKLTHRVLHWPEQLSIKNLPQDYKEKLIPMFRDEKFKDILIELETEGKNLFNHFLNFHSKLDNIRNENLNDSNPMLSEYIKNYKVTETNSQVFFRQQLDYLRDI